MLYIFIKVFICVVAFFIFLFFISIHVQEFAYYQDDVSEVRRRSKVEVKQRRSSFNSGSQVLGVEIRLEIKIYLRKRDNAYLDSSLYIYIFYNPCCQSYAKNRSNFPRNFFPKHTMIFLNYILFLYFNC